MKSMLITLALVGTIAASAINACPCCTGSKPDPDKTSLRACPCCTGTKPDPDKTSLRACPGSEAKKCGGEQAKKCGGGCPQQ